MRAPYVCGYCWYFGRFCCYTLCHYSISYGAYHPVQNSITFCTVEYRAACKPRKIYATQFYMLNNGFEIRSGFPFYCLSSTFSLSFSVNCLLIHFGFFIIIFLCCYCCCFPRSVAFDVDRVQYSIALAWFRCFTRASMLIGMLLFDSILCIRVHSIVPKLNM